MNDTVTLQCCGAVIRRIDLGPTCPRCLRPTDPPAAADREPDPAVSESKNTRKHSSTRKRREQETEAERDARLRASGVTAADLMRRNFPAVEWVVPGVLPVGYTVLAGPPKLGKSWLALQLGLAAAAGGYALGKIRVPARPVVYFALEDSERRLQQRMHTLLLASGDLAPAGLVLHTTVQPGQIIATMRAYLREMPGAVVLLDTLGRVMPPAASQQTAYERDYAVGAAIKNLADDHDASIIAVHHSRKMGATDFLDLVLGSQGIAGAADTIVVVQRDRGSTDALLNVTGRDVEEGTYACTLDRGVLWTLTGADLREAADAAAERRDSLDLGDRSATIVALARQRHPQPITATDVANQLGMSNNDSGRYLRRLADTGKLTRQTRGRFLYPLSETSEVSAPPTESDTQDTSDSPLWREEQP